MSLKYILDCTTNSVCTLLPYAEPETHSAYAEYGFSGTTITWALIVAFVLGLAIIAGIAGTRITAHMEQGQTDRERAKNPPKRCGTCGDEVS